MIDSAGRMATTARRDIGAWSLSPTEKRGSGVCVQMCDDARPKDDDLDWEFVLFRTLGIRLVIGRRTQWQEKANEGVINYRYCTPMQLESTLAQASCLSQSQQNGTQIQFAVLQLSRRISTR